MANYMRNHWTPTEGGNTPFPCPGCTAQITVRQMAEYGGLIEGEDGSSLDLELPEWMERDLKEGKITWEDRLTPCLQCPHCRVIFAVTIIKEVIENGSSAVER